jgi:hypothetical protein
MFVWARTQQSRSWWPAQVIENPAGAELPNHVQRGAPTVNSKLVKFINLEN